MHNLFRRSYSFADPQSCLISVPSPLDRVVNILMLVALIVIQFLILILLPVVPIMLDFTIYSCWVKISV